MHDFYHAAEAAIARPIPLKIGAKTQNPRAGWLRGFCCQPKLAHAPRKCMISVRLHIRRVKFLVEGVPEAGFDAQRNELRYSLCVNTQE